MSDDKPSRAEQHLINEARKHQAHQPQPPGKVTIGRVGRLNGMTSNVVHWLTQAWSPATGGTVGRLAGHEHHPAALAWDRRGKQLAVADGERIIVWDAAAATQRWRLPWATVEGDRGSDGTVSSVQWLDGGGYMMEFRPKGGAWHDEWGTTVATVIVWDIETGQPVSAKFLFEHEQGRRSLTSPRHRKAGGSQSRSTSSCRSSGRSPATCRTSSRNCPRGGHLIRPDNGRGLANKCGRPGSAIGASPVSAG